MIALYKERRLERGMAVEVYRNLHNGLFSIRDRKTKRVLAHGDGFVIGDATPVISKAGQRRTREEKVRNVHAWLAGDYLGDLPVKRGREIRYNPFLHDGFMAGDADFGRLDLVLFSGAKCFECTLREVED